LHGPRRRPACQEASARLAEALHHPVVKPQKVERAPRGAMRKEMKDDKISSVPAGMPAPG
jgi:hypothetical protein